MIHCVLQGEELTMESLANDYSMIHFLNNQNSLKFTGGLAELIFELKTREQILTKYWST